MKIRIPIYAFLAGFSVAYSIYCYISAKPYGGTTGLLLAVWMIVMVIITIKDSRTVVIDIPPATVVDIKPEL